MTDTPQYLHVKPEAVDAYQYLVRMTYEHGANCIEDPDKWTGYDRDGVEIPTDAEAQEMCAGCPVFDLCSEYAELERPAIGIHAGKVWGRGLVIAERSGMI